MVTGKFGKRASGIRNGRSVFVTLLVSFLFIFLVPVLIGSIVYVRIEQILIDNAYRSNFAMLEQVKHVANGRTQEIDLLMRQIAFHPKQQLLMQKDGAFTSPREQYPFIEFMEELARYTAYNSFVEDVYVYFGHSDTILTPTMKTDASTFYQQINTYRGMTFEQYKNEILLGNHFKSYLRTELDIGNLRGQTKISFVQSLPYGGDGRAGGALVIQINEREFRNLLKEVEGLHQGTLYILNRDKDMLIGPKNDERVDAYRSRLVGERGNFLYDADGEELNVSYVTSAENGWTLLSVFPKQIVLDQVNTVKSWSLTTVMACIFFGVLMCVYLTRRHYSPIKHLVRMDVHGRTDVGRGRRNELQFIGDTMQASFGKQDELQQKLTSQMPMMRASFLMRLIHGLVDIQSMSAADLEMLDIRFDFPVFAVALLDIEQGSAFMKEDTEREWMLLLFILINVSGELLGRSAYVFETAKNRVVILFCLPDYSADSENDVHTRLTNLATVIKERFKTGLTIGVSGRHEGMEKIAQCYDEATIAISYKLIEGSEEILYYDKGRLASGGAYRFPTELEVQLAIYVRNGDWHNTERLLDSLYEMNFGQSGITPNMGRWFFLDLYSTLLKLMHTNKQDEGRILPDDSDPAMWMAEPVTAEQMLERLKATYRCICLAAQKGKSDHCEQLYRRITAFIEEHYADNSFGLSMIAEHLDMSSVYISGFFKKHGGVNLTDYIIRTRIEHAKRLLGEALTVQEIALKVGYTSNIVLTKVFKKIEGVTPGQYRAQLRKQKDE